MYTFNTQQASYKFWRGACDACAADHVINSSRTSASVFPPLHLIIMRNAHGAEEGEGLGTRLHIVSRAIHARAKGGRGRKNTYGVTRHIFFGTRNAIRSLQHPVLVTIHVTLLN